MCLNTGAFGGPKWKKSSVEFRRQRPNCLGCQAVGRFGATAVTDHVVPYKGDLAKFWDEDMWQPACKWHHASIKQRLEHMFNNGEIEVDDLWLNSDVAIRLTKARTSTGRHGKS
jgi:5-methylcytosine-specific restriction enzyme A